MSAAAAIRLARENGIRLGISGDELTLDESDPISLDTELA